MSKWKEGDIIPEWGDRPLSAREAADLNNPPTFYHPIGKRVAVLDPEGRVLFTGHHANIGPAWVGWNRIIPDQPFIDLPPKYKVVPVKEEKTT